MGSRELEKNINTKNNNNRRGILLLV